MDKDFKKKIKEVNEEREKNLKILDKFVVQCLSSIHIQRGKIASEIDEFYNNKKLHLKRIRSSIKKSREFEKEFKQYVPYERIQSIFEEVIKAGKNLFDTKIALQKPLNLLDKQQKKIVKYMYEDPIEETFLELRSEPRKVIHTKVGFVALLQDAEIIKLFNLRCFIFDIHKILDICTTPNDDLAFLQFICNRFYCTIVEFRNNYKKTEICLPVCEVDPETAVLCVSNNNIIIRSEKSTKTYFFTIPTMEMKLWENELSKEDVNVNHIAFSDGLCYRYGSKIYFYSSEREICFTISNKPYETDFISIFKDILPRLRHDLRIFCYEDQLLIVDCQEQSSISMDVESIFKKSLIWDFDINEERILFCLKDRNESTRVYFQSYPMNL